MVAKEGNMGNFDEVVKAGKAGHKKGQESGLKDLEAGKKPSLGKAMAVGAAAGVKAAGPGILRNLLRALLR